MKTYKDLRKYVVKHYGETVATAMDKGKSIDHKSTYLSILLTVCVHWDFCEPFPFDFWGDMVSRLVSKEAKKRKRKAAAAQISPEVPDRVAEAFKNADLGASAFSRSSQDEHTDDAKQYISEGELRKFPTGRLGRILELREEIAKRRGEEAARVYDENFHWDLLGPTLDMPPSAVLRYSLVWAHTKQGYAYWNELQNELRKAGL